MEGIGIVGADGYLRMVEGYGTQKGEKFRLSDMSRLGQISSYPKGTILKWCKGPDMVGHIVVTVGEYIPENETREMEVHLLKKLCEEGGELFPSDVFENGHIKEVA